MYMYIYIYIYMYNIYIYIHIYIYVYNLGRINRRNSWFSKSQVYRLDPLKCHRGLIAKKFLSMLKEFDSFCKRI